MKRYRNLVVANWKMNPESIEEAKRIFGSIKKNAEKLKNIDVVICPPFVFLENLAKDKRPKNLYLGVQDIFHQTKGAFTGEVSAEMVRNTGAQYVIVGHSERRAEGETNEIVNRKITVAFESGLLPILCVGEKERDRDGNHLEFLKTQIKECLIGLHKKYLVGITVAYEPIWAIGKSYKESMSPTDIHETTLFIKKIIGEYFGRDIANSIHILILENLL